MSAKKRTQSNPLERLSRRERQIMDAVYARGEASAAEVREALKDPPSYSAVRAQLRILEEKGVLSHRQEGASYIYKPTVSLATARRTALDRVVDTFFGGSAGHAIAALVDESDQLSSDELDQLERLIVKARRAQK